MHLLFMMWFNNYMFKGQYHDKNWTWFLGQESAGIVSARAVSEGALRTSFLPAFADLVSNIYKNNSHERTNDSSNKTNTKSIYICIYAYIPSVQIHSPLRPSVAKAIPIWLQAKEPWIGPLLERDFGALKKMKQGLQQGSMMYILWKCL